MSCNHACYTWYMCDCISYSNKNCSFIWSIFNKILLFELALNDEFIIVYLFATQKSLLMRTCSDIEINVRMICPDDLSGFFIR